MTDRRTRELCEALRKAALFLIDDDYDMTASEANRIALILAECAGVIGMAGRK